MPMDPPFMPMDRGSMLGRRLVHAGQKVAVTPPPRLRLCAVLFLIQALQGRRTWWRRAWRKGWGSLVYTSSASVVFDGDQDLRGVDETFPCASKVRLTPALHLPLAHRLYSTVSTAASLCIGRLQCTLLPSHLLPLTYFPSLAPLH